MAEYINRRQLEKASNEEIELFFKETTFEGIFSDELKSKKTEYYKGNISDIMLEGRPTNLVNGFLNVPKNSNEISEGPCSFKCRMNIDALRGDQPIYIVNLIGRSLKSVDKITTPIVTVSARDSQEQDLFKLWRVNDCNCIGYYHYDEENEVYVVDDLRKPNFDHIPCYPGDTEKRPIRITYPHEINGIKPNGYYHFTWRLSHRNNSNPYEIYIDFKKQPCTIEPKWFIDTLFDDRHNDKSKNFGSATNFLDTLSKQLSAKDSTFVYELLQNANDYPVKGELVDVEFHITDNYLLFLHSGEEFNVRNISGICGINEKEKVANKRAIGYKGIGFKTVFLQNHYVYLQTGDYSFRFDEGETPEKKMGGRIEAMGAPYQILPIWTTHKELSPEINNVFDGSDKKYRVRIALKPEDKKLLHVGKNNYENLFKDIFADAKIILFIPNIHSVRVVINGIEERLCFRDSNEWVVGDYEEEIPFELQESINKTIDKGSSRIPEKYKDFDCTKVSFACKHQGAIIKPVEDAILYCYLPTKASWGFPFLLNSDMIPKGDRNDIETEVLLNDEEKNFNEELTAIAGKRLFDWLLELLTSRKYELGSVFSLVPDFDKCEREHKDYKSFIEQFRDSFEEELQERRIIPISTGIANVNYVVCDKTGLTTTGIMSDDEFFKFAELEDVFLPLSKLRTNKSFNKFLKRYAKKELIFNDEDLHAMIENKKFQEWLKVQENNNNFLNFLLENDMLEEFLDEKIFIEDECVSLYSAKELYYDIDDTLINMSAFSNHLYYLSIQTREFFKDNNKWLEAISDKFAKFDADYFVSNVLLDSENISKTKATLKNEDVSLHFYLFLAKNDITNDEIVSLPFINTADELVDDFEDKIIFFASTIGESICRAEWISDVDISFVSSKYGALTLEYLKNNLGVRDFSDKIIVKEIILSDNHSDDIQSSINEDYDISETFIKYCFENESLFSSDSLRNYAISVVDINGDYKFIIPNDDVVFLSSSLYDTYSEIKWINNDWMYGVDSDYIQNCSEGKTIEFQKFLSSAFLVNEISAKEFYKRVVAGHIKEINESVSGDADANGAKNIDFIKYLDNNYKLIFEDENGKNIFENITLISEEEFDIEIGSNPVFCFDDELKDILSKEWFPENLTDMCTSRYGKSKAIQVVGAIPYSFRTLFNQVICTNFSALNSSITKKEHSIEFHNLVIEHMSSITADELKKMQSAKLYLLNNDIPATSSKDHNILSSTAKELSKNGLVEFSQLNIIDTSYNTDLNRTYWCEYLDNKDFDVSNFLKWLADNTQTFSTTISDVNHNVSFWRWVQKNLSKTTIKELPELPILLSSSSTAKISDIIYLADSYVLEGGIEGYVKKFDPTANFISTSYISEGDNKEKWEDFWISLGVKSEIVHILISTIIPKLEEIDEVTLPATIVKYRKELEEEFKDLPTQLVKLRVKAFDGNFYSLANCIYINCTDQDEPFTFIEIPNQITFDSGDERSLIKNVLGKLNVQYIDNTKKWRHAKIKSYLEIQDNLDNRDLLRSMHYKFLDELAAMRDSDTTNLGEYTELSKVLILNEQNEFVDPKTLTLNSIYNPFCNFQKYGITQLSYTSEVYNVECKKYIGKVFRSFNVHCDFIKADIIHLTNR